MGLWERMIEASRQAVRDGWSRGPSTMQEEAEAGLVAALTVAAEDPDDVFRYVKAWDGAIEEGVLPRVAARALLSLWEEE